jgi:hypothetical protein
VSDPVRIHVRAWNIAHGRDIPPDRQHGHVHRKLLDEMCELIVRDAPDLVLLQEVRCGPAPCCASAPAWASRWPRLRRHIPFCTCPAAGARRRRGQGLPDLVRTQVEGQANAVLYGAELLLVSARRVQINDRRRFAASPASPSWCVSATDPPAASSRSPTSTPIPATTASSWSGPATCSSASHAARRCSWAATSTPMPLARPAGAGGTRLDRGRHRAAPGVDHLFVRGMQVESAPAAWPPELRDLYLDDDLPVRLSDHDPVDAVVTL